MFKMFLSNLVYTKSIVNTFEHSILNLFITKFYYNHLKNNELSKHL